MLLNGFRLIADESSWRREMLSFWLLYKTVHPEHDIYSHPPSWLESTVPFAYHGDEGRGKLRRAVMILSCQPLLQTNCGHSFLSRLLLSIIPGERYAATLDGDETIECLHRYIAEDFLNLFEKGVEASRLIV